MYSAGHYSQSSYKWEDFIQIKVTLCRTYFNQSGLLLLFHETYHFIWWHGHNLNHISYRNSTVLYKRFTVLKFLIHDQFLILSVHFHNQITGVQQSPAQACGGQVPFLPACHFPAAAAATLGLVHIRWAPAHHPIPEGQQVGCFESGRPGLSFGLLPFQWACSGWLDHPPSNIGRNPLRRLEKLYSLFSRLRFLPALSVSMQ